MIRAKHLCAALAAHVACLFALASMAAEPVAGSSSSADARRLSELFYQLQVLQQEVQELRGLVEQQGYQIKRMARDQQEQYIDLDRRVSTLRGGSGAPAASTGTTPSAVGKRRGPIRTPPSTTRSPTARRTSGPSSRGAASATSTPNVLSVV